jgi:Na+-driven multidrug efflux pump/GNAT superfamily N-acetyltransferase
VYNFRFVYVVGTKIDMAIDMAFVNMVLDLGEGFIIKTLPSPAPQLPNAPQPSVLIQICHQDQIIGSAKIITDRVDVEFIAQLSFNAAWSQTVVKNYNQPLAALFIKFLIKFPNLVRKPEFRFITKVPEHLRDIVEKLHFDNGENTTANDIMLRTGDAMPASFKDAGGITFSDAVKDQDWPQLFSLLKANAEWQQHLDMERLHLLVQHSVCIIAKDRDKIVGFARALTDSHEIASIWDVVVAKEYENRGIATLMMRELFVHEKLQYIPQWLLFSDKPVARHIYAKFGFQAAQDLPERTLVQKLRLQTEPPSYLLPLIEEIRVRSKANTLINHVLELDDTQTKMFLEKKRADLPQFWRQQVAFVDDRAYRLSDTTWLGVMLLSMLLVDTYAFRNTAYPYFSGQVDNSTTHQAANAMVPNVVNIMVIFLSLLFSVNMIGAQLVGELSRLHKHSAAWEAKRLEIVDLFRNALIISVAVAPICMIDQIFSERLLIDVMDQEEAVAQDASKFLRPYAAVVPPVFLWMCASQIINAFQYTKLIITGPINFGIAIFLAEGLTLGKFGMPKMGINGIVIAFVTEAVLTAISYYLPLFFAPEFRDLKFWQLWYTSPDFKGRLKKQLYSSAAITVALAFEMGLGWYLATLSTKVSLKAQAAFALAFGSLLINVLVMISSAVSGAIIVGGYKGAQDHADVYRTSRHAVYMTALLCTIIPVFFAIYPEALADLFNSKDPEVLSLLKQIIDYVMIGQIGDGAATAEMLQLRIFNDNWTATSIRCASLVLGAVLATVLVYNSDMGIVGLGIGYAVAEWTSCLALGVRLHTVTEQYREEYNVRAPGSDCFSKVRRQLPNQGEWGFLGRGRQQRNSAPIPQVPVVDLTVTNLEMV